MPRCLLNSDDFAGRGEGCYLKAEVHSVEPYVKEKRRHDQCTGRDNPAADDPSAQFKKEFWALIHQRTIMMDPYDMLYKDNKNKVEGEEYEYLRYTILENFATFKAWSGKLRKVPASELESINTISDLKKKLNQID